MKICFWANSMFRIGGEQKITAIVANKLSSLGFDVTIIIKHNEDKTNNIYNLSKKINIVFLDNNFTFNLNTNKFTNQLRKLNRKTGIFKNNNKVLKWLLCSKKLEKQIINIINKEKFDYVVGIAGDRSFILASLKDKIKAKIIGWNHMNIETHFLNPLCRYQYELNLVIPLFKNFENFIVLTENDKKLLKNKFNINSAVIHNCYESTNLIDNNKTREKKFIAAGRFCFQKGFDILIECFYKFSILNSEWNLELYGDGEELPKYKKMIKNYNLENRIKIYPTYNPITSKFQNTSIYLMTSRHEGFGLVTMEALLSGLPIIAFDLPANKLMIKNNVNGFIIKNYNKDEYVQKMLSLATDDLLRKNMSINAKKSLNDYNIDNVINKWLKIFK